MNSLGSSKFSLKFTNFEKWPIILWLQKTIILDSLPIWTWDQKDMKYNPLSFPSILHLHFLDQRWIKYEFLKLSPYFPKLETFRVSSRTSFNPNLNLFDPMTKMDLKYEKCILELMIGQKFTWSTLTLTDSDQNDHFAPLNQLIHLSLKLMTKTSNIWSSKHNSGHVQIFISKYSRKPDEIPNPNFGQHLRRMMNHL